jgi:HJR/Mrr/RecB family endonuclease
MIARFEVNGRERFDFSRRAASGSAVAGYGRYLLFAATGALLLWLIYRWGTQPVWAVALPPLLVELLVLSEGALTLTFALLWAAFGWREYRESQRMTAVLPQFTLEELRSLSPAAFEKYVAALFRQQEYQVKQRGGAGDLGVDLELVHRDGRRAIAQCKRYQNNVGPDAVRELYGTLIHERAFHAFLVTTGEITVAARAWAQKKPITLIDGKTLVEIVGRLQ